MWLTTSIADIEAIKELEQASDRSTAVIVGAIVEGSLSDAIRRELSRDDAPYTAKVRNEVFHPDGPLGSFGSKIGLAYLLGFSPHQHTKICRT